MKKHNILRKAAFFFIAAGFMVLLIRGYLGDHFFSGKHNFAAPAGQILAPEAESFQFAAVSDTGSHNYPLQRIVKQMRAHPNSFILYLGDLVTYRTSSHFSWMTHEISPKLKGLPFYAIPGNHDIKNQEDEVDLKQYRAVFGADYYWFSYGNTLFVGLNNSDGKIDAEQFQWLSSVLSKIRPQFEHCIIFGHIPPRDVPGISRHKMEEASAAELEKLLRKHKVDMLLFGHVHNYTEGSFAGIPMYTLPSSGQEIRSFVNKFGYVEVAVTPEKVGPAEALYIDNIPGTETGEVWFTDNVLSNKARYISLGLIGAGILILLFLHLKRKE